MKKNMVLRGLCMALFGVLFFACQKDEVPISLTENAQISHQIETRATAYITSAQDFASTALSDEYTQTITNNFGAMDWASSGVHEGQDCTTGESMVWVFTPFSGAPRTTLVLVSAAKKTESGSGLEWLYARTIGNIPNPAARTLSVLDSLFVQLLEDIFEEDEPTEGVSTLELCSIQFSAVDSTNSGDNPVVDGLRICGITRIGHQWCHYEPADVSTGDDVSVGDASGWVYVCDDPIWTDEIIHYCDDGGSGGNDGDNGDSGDDGGGGSNGGENNEGSDEENAGFVDRTLSCESFQFVSQSDAAGQIACVDNLYFSKNTGTGYEETAEFCVLVTVPSERYNGEIISPGQAANCAAWAANAASFAVGLAYAQSVLENSPLTETALIQIFKSIFALKMKESSCGYGNMTDCDNPNIQCPHTPRGAVWNEGFFAWLEEQFFDCD